MKITPFFEALKARNVRKTMAIYLSSALTTIGVVRLFQDAYGIPQWLFPLTLTVLICGAGSAFTYAWYHGAEGAQKTHMKEIVAHALMGVLALVLVSRISWTTAPSSHRVALKSVAVLPFLNISGNKEDEYFSDGITEDILTQLSKIGELSVIARTSIMRYKGKDTVKTPTEIARELGVAAILAGSVQRYGSRARITAKLVNAKTEEQMWAERYDRELKDVFAIQTEVAQNIASALKAELSADETQRLRKKPTANLEAYGYYLRGREYFYHYTKQDNERAIELFRKALALDPNYALTLAGLAEAYSRKQYYDFSPQVSQYNDSAFVLSQKAITLDRDLAEGYKTLGDVLDSREQYRESLEQYLKAVERNPNYAPAIANIGHTYFRLGRFDEALGWMKRAMTIEPGTARWSSNLGIQYFNLGFDSLATLWLRKALTLQPEFFFPEVVLSYIDLYGGRLDSAEARINRIIATHPDVTYVSEASGDVALVRGDYVRARDFFRREVGLTSVQSPAGIKLAFALTKLNEHREARRLLDSILTPEAADLTAYHEGLTAYSYAGAFCIANNTDQALRMLQRAVDLGFVEYRWIVIDPLLDPVRSSREFTALLAALQEAMRQMRMRVQERELLEQSKQ